MERDRVSLVVRAMAAAAIVLIPLRIVAQGYLPADDALSHAARAVSGKTWAEILVLRPGIVMDPHPGWNTLLGEVHRLTGCAARALVVLPVVGLFVLVSLGPLVVLRRPEAWLLGLLVLAVADPAVLARLLLGRPFLVPMALLVLLCLVWPSFAGPSAPRPRLALLAALFAVSAWIHPTWYLFFLPVGCFFLAGERRAGLRLAAGLGLGVLLGGVLSGHPLAFLGQPFFHGYLTVVQAETMAMLSLEIRPQLGSPIMVLAVLLLLLWRRTRGTGRPGVVADPVFVLAAAGWTLSFVAIRFWSDWGAPAALVWIARELEEGLEQRLAAGDRRRLAVAAATAAASFLAIASDVGGRWTQSFDPVALAADNPAQAAWLPDPGGILYSDQMSLFYQTFFRNPRGSWRYMVGFEPALMPPEDVAVYRTVVATRNSDAFGPWVRKMHPEDRLVVRSAPDGPPRIAGLEWHQPLLGLWSGRRPRVP